MTNCSVPYCKSAKRKTIGISFHEFPSKEPRRSRWIKIIQNLDGNDHTWQPSDHSVICGLHFRPEDFKTNCKHFILLPEAVPNVFNDTSKNHLVKTRKRRRVLTRTMVATATKIRSLKKSRKEEKENDTLAEENQNPASEFVTDVSMKGKEEVFTVSVGCQTEILSVKMLKRFQDELRQAKNTAGCLVKKLEMLEKEIKELIDEM
uniref:THAP-type domain-containing protein n=1 Tax=Strigamia maritima TaxID=126957 RepID=T1IW91_STRMM